VSFPPPRRPPRTGALPAQSRDAHADFRRGFRIRPENPAETRRPAAPPMGVPPPGNTGPTASSRPGTRSITPHPDPGAGGLAGALVRDHAARPHRPDLEVGEPRTAPAAMALRTGRIVLGSRVPPPARRRPHDLARQAVSVDRLSGGRPVLGVGPGADTGGELAALGEEGDPRARAGMLDEALEVLCRLWSGERVEHRGRHYRVDGLRFVPRPVQRPRIPVWGAAQAVKGAPLRRAARFDGLRPEASPGHLARMLEVVGGHRGGPDGCDVAVCGRPGEAPEPCRRAGATWWLLRL